MALTLELLQGQESLKGLSEEQLNTIATLSANDETAVIGRTFGQIHSELDEAIKAVTGIGKNTNEKTSDYMKRMLQSQKDNIGGLTSQIADLEKKVKAGIDNDELRNQIASKDATIADLQKRYQEKDDEVKSLNEKSEKAIFGYRIGSDLRSAVGSVTFAEGVNDTMKTFAVERAIENVKGMNPAYIKGADGQDVLVFRDANGAEMRNPQNAMNLYTANELVEAELKKLGVVSDKGTGGAGGKAHQKKSAITGCSTKAEAIELIESMVMQRGISRRDVRFQEEVDKMYDENYAFIGTLK